MFLFVLFDKEEQITCFYFKNTSQNQVNELLKNKPKTGGKQEIILSGGG